MNGILVIDKPAGITSHDVVSRVRRILKTKRVGHTGTLDPFATGVMTVLVGQATRLAQFLDRDEKEYEAMVRFGFETETGDRTGRPKSQVPGGSPKSEVAVPDPKSQVPSPTFSRQELESVLESFRGAIEQTPPMYSAKKVDGKKLYEHARKGETIERKSITVKISELEIITDPQIEAPDEGPRTSDLGPGTSDLGPEASDPGPGTWDLGLEGRDLGLRVVCSAGTYIRTLAEDIARKVGTRAHLAELRRTRSGKFTVDQSLTLEQLDGLDDPISALVPMEAAVSHLPAIKLSEERVGKTRSGLSTRVTDAEFSDGEAVQMQTEAGQLIAIGYYNQAENIVQPKVVLI